MIYRSSGRAKTLHPISHSRIYFPELLMARINVNRANHTMDPFINLLPLSLMSLPVRPEVIARDHVRPICILHFLFKFIQ